MLYCMCTGLFSALRAGREVKSFGPEAIVPKRERDDCMEEVLQEVAQGEVLTVENLNRMNDAFAKFIFANNARKQLTLDLVNSFFEFEGTAQITDFTFSDRELDPERKLGKGVVLDVVGERRKLAMEDANIHTAMEAEKEFVKNPICITAYEQHQKYLRDKHAREKFVRKEGEAIGEARGFAKGEASGIAKGEAIGIAKAERDMIKTLHASGMSAEEIAVRLKKDIAVVRQILQ